MLKVLLFISSILYLSITSSAFANTGEITFQGSIIEEYYCQTSQINNQIQLDCSNQDNTLSNAEIISDSQLEYVNPNKTAAVMQITYH